MLSLGKIAAGPTAARYYVEQVAQGREDYYAGEGEAPGTWAGSGAATLGWSGRVEDGHFAELLEGAGLRRAPREDAVAGFDLTFRAPKSVSLAWAVGGPDVVREIRVAHDSAVAEALGYMEREACRARRGAGGAIQVRGSGFVGAAFVHRSSRAGDPLLHTHVVVGNLTQGPDGRWTALDARHLYRHAKTAGFLYQAVLRRELTERLGLEFNPVERGVADLRGIPRAVIEHFSRRRAQIVEHMASHGGRSAASAQVAALETRRAKQDVPFDRLRADWRARAVEHGLEPDAVSQLVGRVLQLELDAAPPVVDRLTAEASTFGRPEILQALAEAHPSGARVSNLERLADAVLGEPEVLRLADRVAAAGVSERRFTTADMLATERQLITGALERQQAAVGRADGDALRATLADHGSLSVDQRGVVYDLCTDGHGVTVLRAPAGTGKTFVLDAARDAWRRSRIEVVGCALSARAALELHDQAAIPAITIAALRQRLETGHELPRGGVLVVDESGMVGTRDLALLAERVERVEGKLVLVGDDRQLPEIQAGGAFHALAERLGALELREARRQVAPWDRQALEELRSGKVERWARAYREHGRITVAASAAGARASLVNDYVRADGDRLMIACRREDVADLNARARALLKDRGDLGPDELTIDDHGYTTGDRVIATRNDRSIGIVNGQRGTVATVDRERESMTVTLDDGTDVTVAAGYLRDGHLDHGHATTAHRAQGATVDRAFVLGSQDLYREWGYTAMSRHRHEARFYVARPDIDLDRDIAPAPDPVADGLTRLLGRSRAKTLALDNLAELDDQTIEQEHERLYDEVLADRPSSGRHLAHARNRAAQELQDARDREARLAAEREQLGILRWRERAEIDQLLINTRETLAQLEQEHELATTEHDAAVDRLDGWLDEHGADAQRLLELGVERSLRADIDREVEAKLSTLDRTVDDILDRPAPWEHDVPTADPELDPFAAPEPAPVDLDVDIDMDMGL